MWQVTERILGNGDIRKKVNKSESRKIVYFFTDVPKDQRHPQALQQRYQEQLPYLSIIFQFDTQVPFPYAALVQKQILININQ